jgi:hypothetical protein
MQEFPAVRVATLVEQLESSVRVQANLLGARKHTKTTQPLSEDEDQPTKKTKKKRLRERSPIKSRI